MIHHLSGSNLHPGDQGSISHTSASRIDYISYVLMQILGSNTSPTSSCLYFFLPSSFFELRLAFTCPYSLLFTSRWSVSLVPSTAATPRRGKLCISADKVDNDANPKVQSNLEYVLSTTMMMMMTLTTKMSTNAKEFTLQIVSLASPP